MQNFKALCVLWQCLATNIDVHFDKLLHKYYKNTAC